MMRSLLSNLRVRTKMSIAAILLLVPLLYLSVQFFLKTSEDIHSTKLEVSGVQFIAPLQRATALVQHRRALVAQGAAAELVAPFKSDSEELRKTIEEIDVLIQKEKRTLDLDIVWSDLKAKLTYLADTEIKADRARHVALHSDTVQAIMAFQALVAEKSTLDLEPEAAGYYLKELSSHILIPLIETTQQGRLNATMILAPGIRDTKSLAVVEANYGLFLFHAAELERNRWRINNYLGARKAVFDKLFENTLRTVEAWKNLFGKSVAGGFDRNAAARFDDAAMDCSKSAAELYTQTISELKSRLETRALSLRIRQLTVLFLALLGALLSALIGWVILKQISRSLDEAMQISESLASGNLEFEINADTHDEIGAFMNSLQIMAERLRGVLRQVHQGASEIALAAQQVSSTAEMLNNGAMDQAAHVEETGAALGEMVNLIQSNAANAVETDNTANMAVKNTQMGAENVLQAVESMKVISERIQIVQEIAAQTNLLALNATIEAARAGEHGRGFAVVATEVGKLAETSGQAAKQIQALLRDSSAISASAASSLSLITESMQNTAQKVVAIRHASEEQNQAAQQISETMGRLNQTTEQTASAAEELAATAEEMSSQTATLLEGLKFFRFSNDSSSISSNYSAANALKQAMAARSSRTAQNAAGGGSEPLVVHSGSYEKF